MVTGRLSSPKSKVTTPGKSGITISVHQALPAGGSSRISALMTIVPYQSLRPETLRSLIEEFVTREGADHGHTDRDSSADLNAVLAQLRAGLAVIVFDETTESCSVLLKQNLRQSDSDESRVVED